MWLSLLSRDVIKNHEQMHLGKESISSIFYVVVHHRGSRGRSSGQEPREGNCNGNKGEGCLLVGSFLMAYSVCFPVHPRSTWPEIALAAMDGSSLPHQILFRKVLCSYIYM